MCCTSIAVLILTLLGCVASAQNAAEPTVQVHSLEFRKSLPDGLEANLERYLPGTTIRLLLTLPYKYIVETSSIRSNITKLVDDKGSILKDPRKANLFAGADWQFVAASKDHKHCVVQTHCPAVPVAGARSIKLTGTIAALCGMDEKIVAKADVVFDFNLDLAVRPFKIKCSKADRGNDLEVSFTCEKADTRLKHVQFLTADGKDILVKNRTQAYILQPSSTVNKSLQQVSYFLAGTAVCRAVRITYFEKLETINIPVDVEIGVGF